MIAVFLVAGNRQVRISVPIEITGYTAGSGMVEQILHIVQMEAAMIIFIQIGQKIAASSVIVGGGINVQPAASAVIAYRN